MAKINGQPLFMGKSIAPAVFALIQVGYPENDKRPVISGEGFTRQAPDTSGLWLCGVPALGTYTISYGEAPTQTVTITAKGQVESVYISEQTKNYKIIYHLGEELAGGISEGTKSNNECSLIINSLLDLSGFNKIASYIYINRNSTFVSANNVNVDFIYDNNSILNKTTSDFTGMISNDFNYESELKQLIIKYKTVGWNGIEPSIISKSIDYYRLDLNQYRQASTGLIQRMVIKIFSLCLLKTDNISILSSYGDTIANILANSINLFMDRQALTKMCQMCTGDFMFSAVTNATFKTAYTNSENKDILLANEHWAKFIPLMQKI